MYSRFVADKDVLHLFVLVRVGARAFELKQDYQLLIGGTDDNGQVLITTRYQDALLAPVVPVPSGIVASCLSISSRICIPLSTSTPVPGVMV